MRGLGARPAGADRVEHVGAQLESFGPGEAGERAIELGFELVREVHVGHRTTLATREVVMVADECLGQLEPRELADPGHAMDDALGLEHREIAVDAARALARARTTISSTVSGRPAAASASMRSRRAPV